MLSMRSSFCGHQRVLLAPKPVGLDVFINFYCGGDAPWAARSRASCCVVWGRVDQVLGCGCTECILIEEFVACVDINDSIDAIK